MSMTNKILIIDDEQVVVDVLTERLRLHGFEVEYATDGKTGFEKACEFLPDIILMDVIMPGWSGFETANQLKTNHVTADMPIIFLTGLGEDSLSRKHLEKYRHHVLLKPFKIEELLTVLANNFEM
ncbi:MAG: response regulator [Oryzomonas sp.]|uniref:response regulator n=1 Tax=Oryzomonas sp. TaxID=2855186 RepID=UPI00285094BB|nr:response regulator [Oryzomonas sp.]MDR3578590.1 response regulator [Oryzomonas sp.]